MSFIGSDRAIEPSSLPVGQLLGTAAQGRPDAVERVTSAAAVTVDLLLDAASNLVDGLGAELDDMERVKDRDRVLELVIDGVP